eukprot:324146-Chlamydomonas_euryale.AAC.2
MAYGRHIIATASAAATGAACATSAAATAGCWCTSPSSRDRHCVCNLRSSNSRLLVQQPQQPQHAQLSGARTVMRYADLVPGAASSPRSSLYTRTSFSAASLPSCTHRRRSRCRRAVARQA